MIKKKLKTKSYKNPQTDSQPVTNFKVIEKLTKNYQ